MKKRLTYLTALFLAVSLSVTPVFADDSSSSSTDKKNVTYYGENSDEINQDNYSGNSFDTKNETAQNNEATCNVTATVSKATGDDGSSGFPSDGDSSGGTTPGDGTGTDGSGGGGTGTTPDISNLGASTFVVKIPKTIALKLSGDSIPYSGSSNYDVSVTGDLRGIDHVEVVPESTVALTANKLTKTITAKVTQKTTKFFANDYDSDNYSITDGYDYNEDDSVKIGVYGASDQVVVTGNVSTVYDGAKKDGKLFTSGQWEGKFNFTINLITNTDMTKNSEHGGG